MIQVALTTFLVSFLGIVVLILRRLSDIAEIPVVPSGKRIGNFSFLTKIGGLIIKFWWELIVFAKRIGFWIIHFSLEKTLHKIRIAALKIENFSARKLEKMRIHSHDIPHFSFFEDLINKGDKK